MQKFVADDMARQIRDVFKDLGEPVQIVLFVSETGCQYCPETRQLLEEVAALSEKLILVVYDLEKDASLASQYGVERVPGFILLRIEGGKPVDYGIRFAGIPSGHEFTSLINDIVLVSSGNSALEDATREFLKTLKKPVLLQVFTTPT